jgi:GMP synthase (glutamine-hydrolysing)
MAQHLRPTDRGLLVLDYGSQYTLLIARRLREIGIYAEVIDGVSKEPPQDFIVQGIILSGGPDSVQEQGARSIPEWVFSYNKPILGICYGMQLLAEHYGCSVHAGKLREYGKAKMEIDVSCESGKKLFQHTPTLQTVWMSHGDDVRNVEERFHAIGFTEDGVLAAMAHKELPVYGLQFHPEVHHSEFGHVILKNFIHAVCKVPLNWQADSILESTKQYIRETVGDGKVLMAVSGGVDSTVAVVLLARALGPERVTAVFVDNGLLRKNEAPQVEQRLHAMGVQNLNVLDCKQKFYDDLKGITDPEEKRKRIGLRFIKEFEEFAMTHQGFTHLGQGTLYPDVIESAGHGAGSKVIKSHHNVGGLPEKLNLKLVEPFRYLFKDEVRHLGEQLGIPHHMVYRHPFPGPGLGVRILGEISPEKVRILQEADDIYISKLREHGLYEKVWQAFAVLLPVKSVGVMGDNRTYQWTCALRAVAATDGMTAGVSELPMEFLTVTANEIVRKVDGINRVVYDITGKPPATIEWE